MEGRSYLVVGDKINKMLNGKQKSHVV
ncbi:hypothetical protein PEPE_1343 [Pediococcus pentosaceus ATCC 25745]|uniref:Uncharacterized protein n=1 Tax=Pediococcus pentosaceus (strain ATCC 25745 / CCUG 21536 / LMG 10740 / 183-1w) TaxID=278197 RepID=Q03EJ0_PEDPA|nr:hypothetical protein PEPE_1343 [Pediococcus pentosaceus ATCC 25745]